MHLKLGCWRKWNVVRLKLERRCAHCHRPDLLDRDATYCAQCGHAVKPGDCDCPRCVPESTPTAVGFSPSILAYLMAGAQGMSFEQQRNAAIQAGIAQQRFAQECAQLEYEGICALGNLGGFLGNGLPFGVFADTARPVSGLQSPFSPSGITKLA